MGLELDKLKNSEECVIVSNTTGDIIMFSCDLDDFQKKLFDKFGVNVENIKDYFGFDEVQEFFDENDIEYNEEELKKLWGIR